MVDDFLTNINGNMCPVVYGLMSFALECSLVVVLSY